MTTTKAQRLQTLRQLNNPYGYREYKKPQYSKWARRKLKKASWLNDVATLALLFVIVWAVAYV